MLASEPDGWTFIPVLYCDASNFKAYGQVVLEGVITDAQIALLTSSLSHGSHYVPAQLGLQHLALDRWPGSAYDDDHNWHEMFPDRIATVQQPLPPLTSESGTQHAGTVTEFITRIQDVARTGWDPNVGNPW